MKLVHIVGQTESERNSQMSEEHWKLQNTDQVERTLPHNLTDFIRPVNPSIMLNDRPADSFPPMFSLLPNFLSIKFQKFTC